MSYLTINRFPRMIEPDDMFRELWNASSGVVSDMYETVDALVIELPVPGMRPEDIKVSVTGDTLTISGESQRHEKEGEGREYYRKEVRYGRFAQSVTLPVSVLSEQADAQFENGMLRIILPKAEEAKPKQIEVRVGGQV